MGNPLKSLDKHSDIWSPVSANAAPRLAAGAMAHSRHPTDGEPPLELTTVALDRMVERARAAGAANAASVTTLSK
jgi:hypothetical protein